MRCPKCHYLSFEPEPRCKNCGYDLDLSEIDLAPAAMDGPGDLADFDFQEPAAPTFTPESIEPILSRPVSLAAPPLAVHVPSRAPTAPLTTELPLFVKDMGEPEAPLVKLPAVPRAPLAVRRATPDPARLRAKYAPSTAEDPMEQSLLDELYPSGQTPPPAPAASAAPSTRDLRAEVAAEHLPAAWREPVGLGARVLAGALDSMLLGGIDLVIVWLTLSVCGLTVSQLGILPVVPFLVLFMMLDGTYLVLFTAANGQTLGKMAAGIRVVGTSAEAVINDRVTLAQAVTRACGSLISLVPLGFGFWLGLSGDRRTLHDRMAHTRVVRV